MLPRFSTQKQQGFSTSSSVLSLCTEVSLSIPEALLGNTRPRAADQKVRKKAKLRDSEEKKRGHGPSEMSSSVSIFSSVLPLPITWSFLPLLFSLLQSS